MQPVSGQTEEMIAALSALVASDTKVFGEFLGRRTAYSDWDASPEGVRAINALKVLWGITGDDDRIYIGERWECRSVSDVIEWAVEQCEARETYDVGIQLTEFRSVAELKRIHYGIIPELWIDGEIDHFRFHDDTVLAKLELHPDRTLLEETRKFNFTRVPTQKHRLYLGFSLVEKCHFGERPATHHMSDSLRLRDIVMCVNLSRPTDGAVTLSALADFLPGNTPLTRRDFVWSVLDDRKPALQNGVIEPHLRSADRLYERLRSCDEKIKDRVRVAARYLSHMGMTSPLEDQLISLRVALEAIFCHPPATGIEIACNACGRKTNRGPTWMVVNRPPRLLAKADYDVEELRKLFRSVYKVLSKTAHTGRVDENFDRNKVDRVADLLRLSIRKLIEKGADFDWDDSISPP